MADGRLQGKTALVTGAGSGIGRAISTTFAREGARVMAADINEETAKAVAAQIEDSGGEARSLRTDTTSEEDVKAAIQSVVDAWGRIDIMVNNAGHRRAAVHVGAADRRQPERRLLRLPALAGADAEAGRRRRDREPLLDDGAGRRDAARRHGGGVGYAYHASKHAVVGLTKQFGLDGAPHNIRVNALCPGWIDTPLVAPLKMMEPLLQWAIDGTPMGRLGTPEEIAKAALFLSSDDSSFVTGTCLVIDGGWTAR